MKKKLSVFLALEAALCALYVLLGTALPNLFGSIVSFPFKQIGLGLRALSLSGAAGNLAAIVLYAAACLVPAAACVIAARKGKARGEDVLLLLLAVVLFFVLYFSINPHLQAKYLGEIQAMMGSEMLGIAAWSILAGWAALKILRKCFAAGQENLLDYLKLLLTAIAGFLVLTSFCTGLDGLLDSLENLRSSNTALASRLGMSQVFLILQYLVDILPNVLLCGVIVKAVGLIEEMKQEPYADAVLAGAEALSASCGRMIRLVVTSNILFNVLQLVFMKRLQVVNTVIRLPLTTLTLAVALLLMARFIRAHKELKEENESFI